MVINPDGTVQFEGDVQKLLSGRGAAAATPGGLAAQNEAARLAKYGPEQIARMRAAGTTFGATASTQVPAAPSLPTATNVAPVASSNAASTLSFGQRAMKVLRGGGRALGAIGVGAIGADVANTVANTPTEVYEKRFGFGQSNLDSPFLRMLRDTGVRGLGALTDLGSAVNPFSGANAATPTPAAAPAGGNNGDIFPAGANIASGTRAAAASALLNSGDTLAPGLGIMRNNNTNAVTTFNTGVPAAGAVAAQRAAPVAATPKAPQLGTEGGIFGNLLQFANEVNAQKIAAANEGRGFHREIKLGTLGAAQATAGARTANAESNRIKALVDVANIGKGNKKVTTDLMGNPVIVDTQAGTALSPTVNKPVTKADVQRVMKEKNLSYEAVLQNMKENGRVLVE